MKKQGHRLTLVIADNHPVFLQGLATIFQSHPEINIVAQCRNGVAAITAIRKLAPDIAMIDFSMKGLNGLDVLANVNAEKYATRIIFLTDALSDIQIRKAITGGAKAIVLKNSSPEEIVRSVRKVAAGKYQFPKDLAAAVRKRGIGRRKNIQYFNERLTKREEQVAQLVAKGFSNREIGQQIELSEGTVKIHLHNIFTKLDIPNRAALATYIVSRQTAD